MESNKRQKVKKSFTYNKELFNLIIYILNYYINKENNRSINSPFKHYQYVNFQNIKQKGYKDNEFDYLCICKYILIKSKLNIKDIGVIYVLFELLFNDSVKSNNTHYYNYKSPCVWIIKAILDFENIDYKYIIENNDYEYEYESYIYHEHYDELFELLNENKINIYDKKYINIYIKYIEQQNEKDSIFSEYTQRDYKTIKSLFIPEYRFMNHKQKVYTIDDIINLFEFIEYIE
jgi:hypothetical protein